MAAAGQVADGAKLVCFTTGRGIVFGCKPAPSIKLATNTPMYKRMEDDVNCGTILDGEETVQQCGQRIFDLMLKTASGQPLGCWGRRCPASSETNYARIGRGHRPHCRCRCRNSLVRALASVAAAAL